jgi:hypothetical protein
MRFTVRNVAWLFPFLLTGCFHRNHTAQVQPIAPPIVAPQPANPEPVTVQPAPTIAPVPAQPEKPAQQAVTPPAQETPKPPVHHRKPAPKNPQVAANGSGTGTGVSAIGQLSSGDPSDFLRETTDSIAASERGLNAITRRLSDPEQKTAAHIREFLKKARAALASGDVDGAHTLAVKAKILLGELSR